ncbi:unnamed protein product, partial [Rotaria magnacalcarata]
MGKLFLEYRKDKREEKKMERAYEIEIKQLGVKPSSDQQPGSTRIPELVEKNDSKHDPSSDQQPASTRIPELVEKNDSKHDPSSD